MTFKRAAVILAMLVATCPSWAEPAKGRDTSPIAGLEPRNPRQKPAFVQRPNGESRLVVKFKDQLRVRANTDRSLRAGTAASVTDVNAIRAQFNLQFNPAIRKTEADLTALEARAANYSKKAQPDLAGIMYVDGDPKTLEAAANALLALDAVEFAYFQLPFQPFFGPPPEPACGETAHECWEVDLGGPFCGIGMDPNATACCQLVGDFRPFCVNEDFGQWDELCVAYANQFCNPACDDPACYAAPPCQNACYNPCLSPLSGLCFEEHGGRGCEVSECCHSVCAIDTFCCENFWDTFCVDIASAVCLIPVNSGPTPDFTPLQGYLRPNSYLQDFGDPVNFPPLLCGPALANFPGFGGGGYYLFAVGGFPDPPILVDDPNFTPPQRYEGLYGLSRELFEVYNIGETNPPNSNNVDDMVYNARGKGVRVAVIEWSYFGPEPFTDQNGNGDFDPGEPFVDWDLNGERDNGHEDLDVIDEPGQTMIPILDIGHPTHATACLGIINAKDNDKGMVGIAPDAQAFFFPLISVEEGPRFTEAFVNCYNTLGPGDVVSCSFGPFGNLNNDQLSSLLIGLGTNLGIITCVAAGNDCFQLDNLGSGGQNLDPSGAIVVGATFPGFPYCRIPFSNYFREGEAEENTTVHVAAWGTCVAAPGHDGSIFFPNGNWNRSYTNNFGGTSAACPQVAGAIACLQGLAKQFYGVPLSPTKMRAIAATGFPQCGILDPDNLPGFNPQLGCGADEDPDEEPNKIGPYTDTREAGAVVLNQAFAGFDESPLIDDIVIIRGEHVFGNHFSIKSSDDSYFVVNSLFTPVKHEPPFEGPPGEVVYLAAGQTVDIMVEAHSNLKQAEAMAVTTEIQSPGPMALLIVELYSWELNQWNFVDFAMIPEGPPLDGQIDHQVTAAQQYIHPDSLDVLIRLYTVSLGGEPTFGSGEGGTVGGGWPLRFDWINLQVGNGFGFFTPGGPGGVDP